MIIKFIIPFLLLIIIPNIYADVTVNSVQICDVGEFSQIFPFLEVCTTVKSNSGEHSGGTNTGSTGFGDEQEETIPISTPDTLQPEQPKLTLRSIIQHALLGEFMQDRELPIHWTNDNLYDLTVTGIIIDESPLLITFANPPFTVSIDEQIIKYNVQVPTEICEEAIQIGCVKAQLYEIPVTISGLVNNQPVSATETIKIDLTQPEFNIPLIPILLGSGIIGTILIARSIKNRKNNKKQQKRPTGNNKNDSAKNSINRKTSKKKSSGSAKASISRYK